MGTLRQLEQAGGTEAQISEQRFLVSGYLSNFHFLLETLGTKRWGAGVQPLLRKCRAAVDNDRFDSEMELIKSHVESPQWQSQLDRSTILG